MLTRTFYINQINSIISDWYSEVEADNYNKKTDINKDSEYLALQILNLVYGFKLVNLNNEVSNFYGLDLGDKTVSKYCFQVTSRTDTDKLKETITAYLNDKTKYYQIYSSGIKMFIINRNPSPQISKRTLEEIHGKLPEFSVKEDIITYKKLLQDINAITDISILKELHKLLKSNYIVKIDLDNHSVNFADEIKQKDIWASLELIVTRTLNRIKAFEDFYEGVWGFNIQHHEFHSKLEKILDLDSEIENNIDLFLKGLNSITLTGLFQEFIVIERKLIQETIQNVKDGPLGVYQKTGMDFQNNVRVGLEKLVDKLLSNLLSIQSIFTYKYEVEIINKFRLTDITISYSNLKDRNNRLDELLLTIINSPIHTIEIFTDMEDNLDIIDAYHIARSNDQFPLIHLSMPAEQACNYLKFNKESVQPHDNFVAATFHTNPSHILFLVPVSERYKYQLRELQKRSNIALYFFEEE
ncbi:SMEK domain-containing protein [Paenibacillus amylolyticus]|uniref:SMEK domain-containing protein n=1 Tax=Paenibacillus amylolyticus TaxID=1451 RepID=A0ABD8B273_PAEAM